MVIKHSSVFDPSDTLKKLLNANGTNHNVEQFNFADEPDQCLTNINHYIEEKTKDHIKDFLQPNDITSKLEKNLRH